MFACYSARQLPVPGFNGQQAELRIGLGQNTDNVRMSFNAAQQKWVGEAVCVLRSTDQQPIGIDNPGSIDNRGYASRSYMTQGSIINGTDLANTPNVGTALAGGLAIEYRQAARITPIGNAGMSIGTFFYALQDGDTTGFIGTNAGYFTTPPEGGTPAAGAYTGWAETDYLYSGQSGEIWVEAGWQTLQGPISNTTGLHTALPLIAAKTSFYPAVYAYMDSNGSGHNSGTTNDYAVWFRYVAVL
jgi:hypothetical protein